MTKILQRKNNETTSGYFTTGRIPAQEFQVKLEKLMTSFTFVSSHQDFVKAKTNRVEHHGGSKMRVYEPKEFNRLSPLPPAFSINLMI
jgi:hypothetical protein